MLSYVAVRLTVLQMLTCVNQPIKIATLSIGFMDCDHATPPFAYNQLYAKKLTRLLVF